MYIYIYTYISVRVCAHSVVSDSFVSLWTIAHQAPLFMGFPRHDYWSGLYFLLQEIFSIQGLNSCLLHWKADSLPLSHQESPHISVGPCKIHITKIFRV